MGSWRGWGSLTEQVWWMMVTALFRGMASLKGGGSLLRNLSRDFGLPRGANEGLGVLGELFSWLGVSVEPSAPSPKNRVSN